MKKVICSLFFVVAGISVSFGQKYMTRTGKIIFDATTKSSPEKISGVNNEVATIFDAKSGRVIFQVLVKSFKFERELMEEHFNENYMESDKFPKSDFDGSIINLGEINLAKDGVYNAKVKGKLTIHGESHEVEETGTITVKGNTASFKARFSVKLGDYKVSIPSLVADKVSKDATITLESELTQK